MYSKLFLERIVDSIDVVELLNKLKVNDINIRGDNVWCCCPLHQEHNRSFTIGIEGEYKGIWHCFGNARCGSGDLFKLVERLGNFEHFKDAVNFLATMAGVSSGENIDYIEKVLTKCSLPPKKAEPIERVLLNYDEPEYVIGYIRWKRGYSVDDAAKIAYQYNFGTSMYFDMYGNVYKTIGCPIINNGKKMDVYREIVEPVIKRNKRYCRNGKVGHTLFDLNDRVASGCEQRVTVLTEGIWDCIKIRQAGFPSTTGFKNGLTQEQAEVLLVNFDTIYLAFDNDLGGEIGSRSLIEKLSGLIKIVPVSLPKDKKDPDLCTVGEISSIFSHFGLACMKK